MPLYRVTFMNHIVATYLVQADSEEAARDSNPNDFLNRKPEDWDCTMCEVVDVEMAETHKVATPHADS